MRSRLFLSLIAGAALVGASAAQAGTLSSATWMSNIQGNQLTITNTGAMCSDTSPEDSAQRTVHSCSPGGLTPTGTSTGTDYSVSLTVPLFHVTQFTTGGAIDIYTKATLSGPQAVNGNFSAAVATQGVGGQVTVKVAAHYAKGVNVSKLGAQMTTLVKVPLSVGKAGQFTGYFQVLTNPHYITVDFYSWTPHTKTFTGLTTKGKALPTVVAMGTFNLTSPGGGGTVTLVSPSKISIDGTLAQRRTASFTTLKLTYAPEPGTLLLIGAGVTGLVLVGSRRRR